MLIMVIRLNDRITTMNTNQIQCSQRGTSDPTLQIGFDGGEGGMTPSVSQLTGRNLSGIHLLDIVFPLAHELP